MILEEHQHAAGGAAGPQVGTVRPGQQIDRIGGQDGKHDVGTRCAMDVRARERHAAWLPEGDGRPRRPCAIGVDRVESGPRRRRTSHRVRQGVAYDGPQRDELVARGRPAPPAAAFGQARAERVEPRRRTGRVGEAVDRDAVRGIDRVVQLDGQRLVAEGTSVGGGGHHLTVSTLDSR